MASSEYGAAELNPCQTVRKLHDDNYPFWRPRHDAMGREVGFLEGDRYEDDNGAEQKDRRLTQIRGQEIDDTIRYVVAYVASRPTNATAKAVDEDEDGDLAELELQLQDLELRNPWKGYEDREYEAVQSAREARLGVVWMDWEPDLGPFGEIIYRNIDPRRVMWDQGYDPHHPMCGWLLYKLRIDVDYAKKKWGNAENGNLEWLAPDYDRLSEHQRRHTGTPLLRSGDGSHSLSPMSQVKDNKAEFWFCWYKNDYTKTQAEGEAQPFPESDRYMACSSGCGYRTDTQGELADEHPQELPQSLDQACPTCGGDLVRIDKPANTEQMKYFKGRRLVIMTPFCKGPNDEHVYDGDWPIPTVRSFPALFVNAYVKPNQPIGPSDVTKMWDQQVASDNLTTMALQRVFENRAYWEMPATGMVDYKNRRFTFRDDQFNHMYRDATKANMGPLDVKVHQAPAFDGAGWQAAYSAVQQKLTAYRGKADFGLTPESTKNIPVGTVQQITTQENLPILDFIKRFNRARSMFRGCLSDYIHATYTPRRLRRLNLQNIDLAVRLWGQDLPNFDIVVEESPPFTGLEKSKQEAYNGALQAIDQATKLGIPVPDALAFWAKVNEVPKSIIKEFITILENAQAEQEAAMGGVPGGGGGVNPGDIPPDGAPGPEDIAARDEAGLNAGGIPPSVGQ